MGTKRGLPDRISAHIWILAMATDNQPALAGGEMLGSDQIQIASMSAGVATFDPWTKSIAQDVSPAPACAKFTMECPQANQIQISS